MDQTTGHFFESLYFMYMMTQKILNTSFTPDIKPTAGIILEFACGRFVFAIPPATASCITMHTSHPPPSSLVRQRAVDLLLRSELTPRARCLHHITMSSAVQFPELRLIQYDCGTSFQPRLFVFFLYCAVEPGHFEVRKSSSQVTRMHFFPQKKLRTFF